MEEEVRLTLNCPMPELGRRTPNTRSFIEDGYSRHVSCVNTLSLSMGIDE